MPAQKEQKDGGKENANGILASATPSVGVVVNARFEILQFYGFTGKYLEPSPGNADLNVIKMAKEGLAFEIKKGVETVKKSGESYIQEIILPVNHQFVILEILPFFNTTDALFLILFKETVSITDSNHPATNGKTKKPDSLKEAKDPIDQLEQELVEAKAHMQNLVEEHAVVNEELLSGNEELQRLYEELETSSEELQSSNEELISLNEELLDGNEQINQSRLFAEATISTLHEPFLILDKNFIIKRANKSFYKTFQLKEEETLGYVLFKLQHNSWNIPDLRKGLKKLQKGKEKFIEVAITFKFPALGERNIIFNIQPIIGEKNEQLILLAFNDITEIKNMVMLKEKAALLSKERQLLHDFFMQAPALFAILKGPEHIFEFANPLSIEFFGNRNPTGKTVREALPELAGQGFYELMDNVYKTGEFFYANEIPVQLDRGNIKPDLVYVNLSYQPLKNEQGKTHGILALAFDVTEQVTSRKKIEGSDLKLRHLLQYAPVPMVVFRSSAHIVEVVNEKAQELWGRSEKEMLNKPVSEGVPDAAMQGLIIILDNVYKTGVTFFANEMPVVINRNGKFETTFLNFVYEALHEIDGSISGVLAVGTEVTQQVIARKKIEEAESRFRMALKGSSHIVFSQDENLKHTWIYNSHPDFDAAAIIGKHDYELHEPGTAERLTVLKESVLASGNPVHTEIPMRMNEEEVYYDIIIEPLKNEDGKTVGITGVAVNTTESVNARMKIEESEQRLRLATESTRIGTYELNILNDHIVYSQRVPEIFGLDISKSWKYGDFKNLLHPQDVPVRTRAYELAMHSGNMFYEARVVWPDASIHWIRLNGRVQFKNDTPYKMNGTILDITEEKRVTQILQDSEERYSTIVNASNLGLWDYDALNNKINLTGKMAEIYGFSSNEIITVQDLYDAIHPEDREIQANHYKELLTPDTQYPCEVELRIISRQSNQLKWVKSNCKSFFNEEGKMYRMVGTTTDITAQKYAESDLKRFKHMADNATEPFILIREDASFAYLNNVALERWGYTREEAPHIRVSDVDPNYTDEVFPPAFAAAQKGDLSLVETLHKRKDGTIYPVEVNLTGLTIEGKQYLFAVARDITERRKIEEILNYRKALLEAQNEAIPDAILIVDTKGNMLSFNQHFIKLWKIPEDIINRKDDIAALQFAMTQLTDPQSFIDRVNYCYAHPDEKAKEEVHFKDGRIIERYGNIVIGEDGTSYGWAWYFRDITEQRKTEENIKIVKDQLELTFKNIPAGVYLLNSKGEMIYVNEKGASVYGDFTPEDFLEEKDLSALFKKAEELFDRYDEKGNIFKPQNSPAYITLTTGRSSEAILRQVNKTTKEERWHYVQGAPLFDEEGKVSMVLVTSTDITIQKNAEEKIRQSEERFQAAVSAVEGILWTNNANGEMEGEQPGWAMLTGQTFEEYQGYGWSSAVHPDDAQPTVDAWNENVKEKKIFVFEHRVKMKDGNWGHFSIRAIPLLNSDGSVRQWVGVHTNITEKRQAEELLRKSEEQLRSLANSIPQLAWMTDAEGWIYWYNQRWYDYTGTTLEEVQGWGWQSVHHPELIADVTERFSKAIAAGVPYEQTFLLRSKEGEYRWFLTRAIPIRNDEGKVVQWFGTNTDVTDQRNIEDALKESEARFRLLADSMPQQIWTGDADGNLNYFNGAVYEFSGLTFEDIQRDGWIQIVHPDDREANITKWMHSIKTGEEFFIEHRFKHNSGEYRWQLSRAIPQKNNEGHIQLWVGTSTDIHEQKIKEQKKDEFLSIASHEMKTPLTTAKAYLQLLEHSLDKENENTNLYVKKAKDSVTRINDLIGELLDVSKIQYGKLNYNLTSFNFNEMIEGIVEDMQHSSPKHSIIKTGKVQQQVTGDRDRLQQVVINLISNAIKYSPDAAKVFIEVAQLNNEIKVSVRDTGIGMSPHHLEKIFDRYYRVEEHAIQFQGLGIGLYISYEIILRHNGKLWAESELGKGSTFYFTLPATNV